MKKILLFLAFSFFIISENTYCNIDNNYSESEPFSINVKYNYWSNEIAVDFISNSDKTITIQKPINGWTVFLGLDFNIDGIWHDITFVTYAVDSSFFIKLSPKEKKTYTYLIKDFGYSDHDKKHINKIQFRYSPQKTHLNQHYNNLVLTRLEKEIYVSHYNYLTIGIILGCSVVFILLFVFYWRKKMRK